ncbi:MAG: hypothetical protein ACTSR3_05020 [Candidatus Helarchaeota archaeon]
MSIRYYKKYTIRYDNLDIKNTRINLSRIDDDPAGINLPAFIGNI